MRPYDWKIGVDGFKFAGKEVTQQLPHRSDPIPFLSQQISSTAELTYTDLNRDREVAFAMDDFSEGLADNLRFNLARQRKFRYAKNADTSFAPYVLPAPKVHTVGSAIALKPSLMIQRGSVTYLAAGTTLYQVADATSTPVLDVAFAADITDLLVWGGFLIVGLGSATNFRYRASDTSTGAFTDGGDEGHYFAALNDTLYRAIRPDKLYTALDVTGPWTEFDVGDSSYTITSLEVMENLIMTGKENGPHAFDSDFVAVPVVPEMLLQADTQVCKAAITFNRDYYFSSRRGMVRIRPGEGIKSVGLDLLADPALPDNESRPAAFTADGRFLYANIVPASDGVYIWKMDLAGNWHNYLYRTDLGASANLLHATNKIGSTSVNAIVFAYASGGNWQLAYARWPATVDPTKDSAYTFETEVEAVVRTLDYVASYPTIRKFSDRLKSVADDAADTRRARYSAFIDDEATAQVLGDFQKSPDEEHVLGDPIEYHRASLQISISSEEATAQKLRAFHLSAAFLAREVRKHTCNFLATSYTPLASGGRARNDWQSVAKKLRALGTRKQALKCEDEDGRTFTAYVQEVREWRAQEKQGPEFSPVQILTVVLHESPQEVEA